MNRKKKKQLLLGRVRLAAQQRQMATREFEKNVVEARECCTLREIADAAEISDVGVLLIERRSKSK